MSATRKLPWLDDIMYGHDYWWWIDHFNNYTSTDFWTTVTPDGGTATVSDAANGILTLAPNGGTPADNDEIYVRSTTELFLFADTRIIYGAWKFKWPQANTDQAQNACGFMNAVAANSIVDDAGLRTNFVGAAFYTKPGNTNIWIAMSDGTTQTLKETGTVAANSAWQIAEMILECKGTNLFGKFLIDGKLVKDTNGYDVGSQVTTFAGATEMHAFMGCKKGSATAETATYDFAKLAQSII